MSHEGCPSGTFRSVAGSQTCVSVGPGFRRGPGGFGEQPCPVGSWSAGRQHECSACPPGLTTKVSLGPATGADQCGLAVECSLARGDLVVSDGSAECRAGKLLDANGQTLDSCEVSLQPSGQPLVAVGASRAARTDFWVAACGAAARAGPGQPWTVAGKRQAVVDASVGFAGSVSLFLSPLS